MLVHYFAVGDIAFSMDVSYHYGVKFNRNKYNVVVYIVRNMSLFAIIYGKYFVVVNKKYVLHLLNLR